MRNIRTMVPECPKRKTDSLHSPCLSPFFDILMSAASALRPHPSHLPGSHVCSGHRRRPMGDEGKGKIVDHLSEKVDIVARYQEEPTPDIRSSFPRSRQAPGSSSSTSSHPHLPSPCHVRDRKRVVLDPVALMTEIDELQRAGVKIDAGS